MADAYDLAVDLHDLWFTQRALIDMQGAHTTAAGVVEGCTPMSSLMRPDSIGLGSTGFYDDWAALKDQVVTALNTNASSLGETATAMEICIDTFVRTDDDVRQEFRDRQREIPYE